MSLHKFDTDFDWIPWASPEQMAAARAYVEKVAPDLVDVIFGEEGER